MSAHSLLDSVVELIEIIVIKEDKKTTVNKITKHLFLPIIVSPPLSP
jgi:hypothetical protein